MCQVSLPQQEQVLYIFCLCSCINNSCMEEESVGVTYNKLVVSKAGDFIVHMSHMVYFSKTNENRSSENDPLLFILSLVGHGPNPKGVAKSGAKGRSFKKRRLLVEVVGVVRNYYMLPHDVNERIFVIWMLKNYVCGDVDTHHDHM